MKPVKNMRNGLACCADNDALQANFSVAENTDVSAGQPSTDTSRVALPVEIARIPRTNAAGEQTRTLTVFISTGLGLIQNSPTQYRQAPLVSLRHRVQPMPRRGGAARPEALYQFRQVFGLLGQILSGCRSLFHHGGILLCNLVHLITGR